MSGSTTLKALKPGFFAWLGMVGFAGAADYWLIVHNHETMSAIWGDAILHPVKRWPLFMIWTILTLHLFGRILPPRFQPLSKYDPIGWLARKVAKEVSNLVE